MQRVTTNVVLYSNSVLFHQYHLLLYIGHERENIHCGRKNRLTYERIDNGITSLCTGTRGQCPLADVHDYWHTTNEYNNE
jgi:hypothetical protein